MAARKPVKDNFPPMPPQMPPNMPPYVRKPKKPMGFLFWTFFFVVIFSLFFVSAPRIRTTLENTGLLDRLSKKNETLPPPGTSPTAPPVQPPISPAAENPASEAPASEKPASEKPASPVDVPPEAPQTPLVTETKPASQPVKPPTTGKSQERAFYFIRVDGDGAILRTPVTRAVAVSASPLVDTLRLLLQGPTPEEQDRGLITLIPSGAKLLSAQVRGSTAYISFSEEFQFNRYGMEGYVGQMRQIIWTVTEFPNIADVQILIEGRIIEYLGEQIKIGSPLGRNSF